MGIFRKMWKKREATASVTIPRKDLSMKFRWVECLDLASTTTKQTRMTSKGSVTALGVNSKTLSINSKVYHIPNSASRSRTIHNNR